MKPKITPEVRVNTKIKGKAAEILLDLKARGIAQSNTDAITQGMIALWDVNLRRDYIEAKIGE